MDQEDKMKSKLLKSILTFVLALTIATAPFLADAN